jgi:hypothetical protein
MAAALQMVQPPPLSTKPTLQLAETLRLGYGVPRRWLEDGKEIVIERAPTVFGEVSFRITSDLKHGKARAEVTLPDRNAPRKTLLRFRMPRGYRIVPANDLKMADQETVDLSGRRGRIEIEVKVEK